MPTSLFILSVICWEVSKTQFIIENIIPKIKHSKNLHYSTFIYITAIM